MRLSIRSMLDYLPPLTLGLSVFFAAQVHAADPHVHGIARLQIAVDGQTVDLIFTSPAASLIGFEHEPATAAQKRSLLDAIRFLQTQALITQTDEMGACDLVSATVRTPLLKPEERRPADRTHAGGEDSHAESELKDSADAHDHHESHADNHQGEEAAGELTHSEISVIQQLSCPPGRDHAFGSPLLVQFPGIDALQVQWVTKSAQGSMTLSERDQKINLN